MTKFIRIEKTITNEKQGKDKEIKTMYELPELPEYPRVDLDAELEREIDLLGSLSNVKECLYATAKRMLQQEVMGGFSWRDAQTNRCQRYMCLALLVAIRELEEKIK